MSRTVSPFCWSSRDEIDELLVVLGRHSSADGEDDGIGVSASTVSMSVDSFERAGTDVDPTDVVGEATDLGLSFEEDLVDMALLEAILLDFLVIFSFLEEVIDVVEVDSAVEGGANWSTL